MQTNMQGGLNAIKYQGSSLCDDIANIIEKLISTKQFTQKGFEKSRLFNIIKDRTGLHTEPEIVPAQVHNAAIMPPYVNPNHSYFDDFQRSIARQYFDEDFRKLRGEKGATVDRANGRVSGFYTEMPGKIYLYTGLADGSLTPHEIAAIILHEYGHLYYYFEGIHSRFHDMSVLTRAINEANGIHDKYQRRDIITYALNMVNVEVVDPDGLTTSQVEEADSVDAIVWGAYIDGSVNDNRTYGDSEYNWRANEQLADHFATMHGAGPYLATALRKIHNSPFDKNTSSRGAFIFTEVIKTMYLLFPPTGAFILLYLFLDDIPMTYDGLPKRLKLMRQHLVGEISANFNNQQMVARLKEDLEFIKNVERSIYDRKTLYDYIQGAIVPRIRRLNKQEKKNVVIEDLIHNELLIAALQLKQ